MILSYIMNSKYYRKIYEYMLYISYLLFGLAFTGIYNINPYYLSLLNNIIKYYVCIFLLIQFNPFFEIKEENCNEFEFNRKIAFSAGIFLLLTTSITDYASYILNNEYIKIKL